MVEKTTLGRWPLLALQGNLDRVFRHRSSLRRRTFSIIQFQSRRKFRTAPKLMWLDIPESGRLAGAISECAPIGPRL